LTRLKTVFYILLLSLAPALTIYSVDFTWTGFGTIPNEWTDVDNWDQPAQGYPNDSGDTATITSNPTISVPAGLTIGGLTINNNSATLTLSGSLTISDAGSPPDGHLTITDGDLITNGNTLDVDGNLTIGASGTLNASAGGIIYVENNWSNSGNFIRGNSDVRFNSTGSILNANELFYDMAVSGGTRTVNVAFRTDDDLRVWGGTLNCSANITVDDQLTISGGTMTVSGGTMNVTRIDMTGVTTGSLTVNTPASLTVSNNFTISGSAANYSGSAGVSIANNFTISDGGATPTGNITISSGDLDIGGGTNTFGGTVTLNGADGDILIGGGSTTFNSTATTNGGTGSCDISVGTLTNNALLDINDGINMTGGTLDGSGNIQVGGNVTLSNAAAAFNGNTRTITVSGNWNESASVFSSASSTVLMNGAGTTLSAVNSFDDLTINSTITQNSNVTVDADLSISGGTLSLNNRNLTVWDDLTGGGNLTASGSETIQVGGDFSVNLTAVNSEVVFVNGGNLTTIYGNRSFNDFTCTTNGKTIRFNAGTTQTINGSFTIDGDANNLISLISSSLGSPWTINNSGGSEFVDYALIRDSGTVLSNDIDAANSRDDGGNDTTSPGWIFGQNTVTWDGSSSNDWNTGANWLNGFVPNTGDIVVIPTGAANMPATLATNTTIDQLTIQAAASVDANGLALTTSTSYENLGTMYRTAAGGESAPFDGNSGLVVYRGLAGGTIEDYGSPGTDYYNLQFNSTATFTSSSDMEVAGILTISAGTLSATAGSVAANTLTMSGGSFSNSVPLTVSNDFTINTLASVYTGTGTVTITTGDIVVSAGSATFDGAVDISNAAGGDLRISGTGAVTNTAAMTIGTDLVITAAGTLTGSNDITVTGTLDMGGGTFTLDAAQTLDLSNAPTLTAGTLTLNGNLNEAGLAFPVSGTTVNVATGTFVVGALTVSAGSLTQTGASAVQSVGSISVSGTGTLTWDSTLAGGTLVLSGPIDVTGGSLNLGNKTITGVTSFSVTAGNIDFGSADITTSSDVTVTTAGTLLDTAGIIRMDGAGNLTIGATTICDLEVGAAVTVNSSAAAPDVGVLTVLAAGTLAVGANDFQANSATDISGDVTIAGGGAFSTIGAMTVSDGGSVSAAGTGTVTSGLGLTINGTGAVSVADGALTVSAGGLNIAAAGGSLSSTGTGTITVTGAAANSGTISGGSGVVTFNNTLTSGGTLNLGAGVVTVVLAADFSGGTIDFNGVGAGLLVLQNNLTMSAGTDLDPGADLDGTVDVVRFTGLNAQTLDSGGQAFPSVEVNKSGGSLTLTGNDMSHVATGTLTFACTGLVTIDLTTNSLAWTLSNPVDINTNVTFNIGAGTLDGTQDVTISGTGILTHTTGTLDANSFTHTSSSLTTAFGTGTINVAGAFSVSAGTVTQTGASAVQSVGSISVSGTGTLTWDSTLAGGTLVLSGPIDVTGGSLNLGNKTITGVTSFSVTAGNIDFGSADITTSSDVTVTTAGTLLDTAGIIRMDGAGNLTIGATTICDLEVGAAVTVNSSAAAPDVGVLTVLAAGTLAVGANDFQANSATDISGDVTIAGGGAFSTIGAMTVSDGGSVSAAGTGTVTSGLGLTINGTGAVSVADGALTVSAGGLNIAAAGGSLSSTGTGTITVTGAAANSGTISGGSGVVTFNNTLTSGGTLNLGAGVVTVVLAADFSGGTIDFNGVGAGLLVLQNNLTMSAGTDLDPGADLDGTVDVVRFTGLNAQTLDSGGQAFPSVEVNKSGGSLTLTGNDMSHVATGTLTFACTGLVTIDLTTNSLAWTLSNPVDINTNVTFNIGAGTLDGTQDVTISGTGILTHTTGTLDANSFTHTSSSLTTAFGTGTINVAGAFSVSAGTVTQTGASAVQSTGSIAVSGTGTLTWDSTLAGGTLVLSGPIDVTGGSLNLGNKTITGVTTFKAEAPSTGNVNLNGSLVTCSSDVIFTTTGIVNSGTSTITMTGGNLTTNFALYNLTVSGVVDLISPVLNLNNNLNVTAGIFTDNGNTINIYGDWTVTGAFNGTGSVVFNEPGPGLVDQFMVPGGAGSSYGNITITKIAGTRLTIQTSDLTVNGVLTVSTATDIVDLTDINFTINQVSNNGTFELDGTQTTQTITTRDTDSGLTLYNGTVAANTILIPEFYDLQVDSAAQPFELGTDITLGTAVAPGDLTITAGTTLDVSASNYRIDIYGDWYNQGGTFIPQAGTVEFKRSSGTIQIDGNNTWYVFRCWAPGVTIAFQAGRTQTFSPGGTFSVHGSSFDTILPATPPPLGPNEMLMTTDAPGPIPASQWTLDIVAAGVTLDLAFVWIDYSHVIPDTIVPPGAQLVDVVNCTGWLTTNPVLWAVTWDEDNNGKIDRIIVNAAAALDTSPDFSGLTVTVAGYDLDYTANPPYPFSISPVSGTFPDRDLIVHLVEKPYLDTDVTPQWTLTNTSLLDDATLSKFLDLTVQPNTPEDWCQPIIGYTLAFAGGNEVFVHFSEPVEKPAGGDIDTADFTLGGSNPTSISYITPSVPAGGGTEEILLTFASPVTVANVFAQQQLNTTALQDFAAHPDSGTPAPNTIFSATHRVTDIGLGPENDDIVFPVWATDGTTRDPVRGGIGRTTRFDGSGWLQDKDLSLQARVNSAIGPGTVDIRFDSGISSSLKLNGLSLPYDGPLALDSTSDYNGLVPYPNGDYSREGGSNTVGQLWDFTLFASDPAIADGANLEFFFELPGPVPLLCGYIDGYSFSDWYRRVRPWSFKIRDLRTQRGDATVTNNVINPLRGETVYVSYSIPQTGMVTINVFDLKGDIVDVLYRGQRTAGEYSTTWDGRNRGNRVVARGVYFIKIVGPGISEIRKVLVVK